MLGMQERSVPYYFVKPNGGLTILVSESDEWSRWPSCLCQCRQDVVTSEVGSLHWNDVAWVMQLRGLACLLPRIRPCKIT